MNKVLPMLAMIMAVILISCGEKKNTMSTEENEETTEQQDGQIQDLILTQDFNPDKNDAFEVKAVSLDGDILTVLVEYSGGCEDHEFNLKFNGAIMKSLPPQANLFLEHKANGDSCRALIRQELKFNISSVYQGEGIILHLNNYDQRIEYKK